MTKRLSLGLVLVIGGCGSDDRGEGGSEVGSTTTGAGTTDATGGPVDTSTTGAPSCTRYKPAESIGPAVSISVHHDGTTPVFFRPHGCAGAIVVDVTSGGMPLPWLLDEECMPNTCNGFVVASDCSVGCNNCAAPDAGRIEAGVIGQSAWPGRMLTELELDPACAPAADCPATCLRDDQAPDGSYELALTVYRTCTGSCECDTAGSAICGLFSGEQLADPVTFSATIDYPTQTSVAITITD